MLPSTQSPVASLSSIIPQPSTTPTSTAEIDHSMSHAPAVDPYHPINSAAEELPNLNGNVIDPYMPQSGLSSTSVLSDWSGQNVMMEDTPPCGTPPSTSSNVLFINSLQLVREVYKRGVSNPDHQMMNNPDMLNQLSWILGEASSIPPLFNHIEVFRQDSNPHEFTVNFKRLNISIQSNAPTQWLARNGGRSNFGDLLLFALQEQTGVTKSQHIAALGHLPFVVMRKQLASILSDGRSDPNQVAPQCYDDSVLTPIAKIDPFEPMRIDTVDMLFPIFRMSAEEAAKNEIVIGEISLDSLDFVHLIESRHRLPHRKPFVPKILFYSNPSTKTPAGPPTGANDATTNQPATTGNVPAKPPTIRPSLASATPTIESLLHSVESDLIGSSTLLRVDRCLGSHMVRLFDRHLQPRQTTALQEERQLQRKSQSSTNTIAPSAKADRQRPPSQQQQASSSSRLSVPVSPPPPSSSSPVKPSPIRPIPSSKSHRAHPYGGEVKARTLYESLASRKWKPIVVVPSSLTTALVHLGNCKEFLENRQLPSICNYRQSLGCTTERQVVQGEDFTWKIDVPMSSSSSRPSSHLLPGTMTTTTNTIPVELKIVGDSQVTRFKQNDWFRTIAVLVQGPDWQFSRWPFENLATLFKCIRGVYFAFESDPLPPLVEKFPIEVLRLKRTTRHSDVTAWTQFVRTIASILQAPRDFTSFDGAKMK